MAMPAIPYRRNSIPGTPARIAPPAFQLGVRTIQRYARPKPRHHWDAAVLARRLIRYGSHMSICSAPLKKAAGTDETRQAARRRSARRRSLIRTALPMTPGSAQNRRRHNPSLIRIASACCLPASMRESSIRPSTGRDAEQWEKVVGNLRRPDVLHLARIVQVRIADGFDDRNLLQLRLRSLRSSTSPGRAAGVGDVARIHLNHHDAGPAPDKAADATAPRASG